MSGLPKRIEKSLSPTRFIRTSDSLFRQSYSNVSDYFKSHLSQMIVPNEISNLVDRMPKVIGSLGYDPWGYNPNTAKVGLSILKYFYDYYFKVKTNGLEYFPKQGKALVIANHSGQLPLDGILIGVALATNENGPRAPRAMIERFAPQLPFIYSMLTGFGAVVGDPINCVKMLENDEAVIVFPEGVRGSGKPYKKRYQLQYMGTGFVRIAIKTQSPIIPVGVVGCEETMPSLGSIQFLAKMLSVPYVPITVPIPLPAKVYLNFGKPMIMTGNLDDEDEMKEKVEEVKLAINDLIKEGLTQRGKKVF